MNSLGQRARSKITGSYGEICLLYKKWPNYFLKVAVHSHNQMYEVPGVLHIHEYCQIQGALFTFDFVFVIILKALK